MTVIKTDDKAPDFELQSHTGETVRLADFAGKPVVLFFYPKDGTMVCTKEACAFRDQHQVFSEMGAVVIGVSSDSVESHQTFAQAHRLNYILLHDKGGKLRAQFGVPRTLGLIPGRTTYVIDSAGTVRYVFSSQLNAQKHVDEAIDALRRIIDNPPQAK